MDSSPEGSTSRSRTGDSQDVPTVASGWQCHQSFMTMTVFFYVAAGVQEEELDIRISHNSVVAGLRGRQPIVNARLFAPIEPVASKWQLEKPIQRQRIKLRQRKSGDSNNVPTSEQGSSSSDELAQSVGQLSSDPPHATEEGVEASTNRGKSSRQKRQQSSEGSTGARKSGSTTVGSPARSISSTESYDMLDNSVSSLPSTRSQSERGSSVESDPFVGVESSQSTAHRLSTPSRHPSPPDSSSPESPPSPSLSSGRFSDRNWDSGENDGNHGVSSLSSSTHIEWATSISDPNSQGPSSERSSQLSGDDSDARLVTIHLAKIEGGMWPHLTADPEPAEPWPPVEGTEDDDLNSDVGAQSTFSMQSDDSTVLALRRPSFGEASEAVRARTESDRGDRLEAEAAAMADQIGFLSSEPPFETDAPPVRHRSRNQAYRFKEGSSSGNSGRRKASSAISQPDVVSAKTSTPSTPPKSSPSKHSQTNMVYLASGAAVVSAVVAGSLVALGWWRRAAMMGGPGGAGPSAAGSST